MISHDKKELVELLDEFKNQGNYDRLQNLINTFLDAGDETILKKFDDLFRKSTILKPRTSRIPGQPTPKPREKSKGGYY